MKISKLPASTAYPQEPVTLGPEEEEKSKFPQTGDPQKRRLVEVRRDLQGYVSEMPNWGANKNYSPVVDQLQEGISKSGKLFSQHQQGRQFSPVSFDSQQFSIEPLVRKQPKDKADSSIFPKFLQTPRDLEEDRKRELIMNVAHAKLVGAGLDLVGKAIETGVRSACNVHPAVHDACVGTIQAVGNGVRIVLDETGLKEPLKRGITSYVHNRETRSVALAEELGIPVKDALEYNRTFENLALTVVPLPGVKPATRVAGRVLGSAVKVIGDEIVIGAKMATRHVIIPAAKVTASRASAVAALPVVKMATAKIMAATSNPIIGSTMRVAVDGVARIAKIKESVVNTTTVLINKTQQAWQVEKITNAALKAVHQPPGTVEHVCERWQRSYLELYETVSPLIPTYPVDEQHLALELFSEAIKKGQFAPLVLKDIRHVFDSSTFGKSGSLVCILQRVDESIPFFVKTLPRQQILKEIVANETCKSLCLQSASFPKIIAIGQQTHKNGSKSGLIALSAVPGESISLVMKKISQLPADGLSRIHSLEEYKLVIGRIGVFLADLHNQKVKVGSKPSAGYLAADVNRLRSVVGVLEAEKIPLPIEKGKIEGLIQAFEKNPGLGGFTHGDAHLPNFLWDGNQLYAIDLQSLARSIGSHGAPIGVSVKDYMQMHFALSHYGKKYGLKSHEIMVLQNEFQVAYRGESKVIHTKESQEFYKNYWKFYQLLFSRE